MKKILLTLAAIAMVFAGCTKGFEERLTNLENRVSELEAFVTNLNSEVKGIQTIVSNLQKNVYVTGVEPIKNASGVEIGYKLTFNQGNPIEIKHGNTGAIGETGAAGKTPTIDLGDDGQWYWRYSGGDWILDSNDNKIPVYKNIEFEIDENGHLLLYVNGTYTADLGKVEGEQGPQGPDGAPGAPGAPGANADSWFENVTVDEEAGTVTIDIAGTDNDLVLPFNAAAADEFALELQLPSTPAVLGGKITIGYEITGCSADAAALFVYQLPEGWTAEVDSANGTVEFTTTENAGKVVLFAINNETSDIKAKFIDFDPEKLLFLDVEQTTFELPATGGSVKFPVSTGLDFKVKAPEWITPKKTTLTKAMAYYEYELVASENDGDALREGEVKFVNSENEEEVYFSFTVSQKNYNKAILGEYLESYIKSGMPQRGTLKIELSDDFTKGTYKVTICGETLYANYEAGKLLCYDSLNNPNKTYTREIKVSADYSKFENTMWSLGSFTITNYVALKPLGAPELTAAEQALVGTYDESWVYNRATVTSSGQMTISASEDAAYGQLKVKFLYVGGTYAECYATLSSDEKTLNLNSQGVAHSGTYSKIQQPIELAIAEDGKLTVSSFYVGISYYEVSGYVATKVVQGGDEPSTPSGITAADLVGTWNESFTFGEDYTGTLTITETDSPSKGQLKVRMLAQSSYYLDCYADLSSDGTTLTAKTNGVVYQDGSDYASETFKADFVFDVKENGKKLQLTNAPATDWMRSVTSYSATKVVETAKVLSPSDLVGTWSEVFTFGEDYTGTMTISETDSASKGQLKVRMLAQSSYYLDCYADLSSDGTTLTAKTNGVVYQDGSGYASETFKADFVFDVKENGKKLQLTNAPATDWMRSVTSYTSTKQ